MTTMVNRFVCVSWIWVGFGGACLSKEPDLTARLRTEAPQKWAEYKKAFSGKLRYSSVTSYKDWLGDGKSKPRATGKIIYGTHGVLEFHQNMEAAAEGSGYVFALNDHYAFELKRKSPTAEWLLAAINLKSKGLTPHMQNGDIFSTKSWGNTGPFGVGGGASFLPEMFKMDHFQITSASPLQRDSKNLVRAEFRLDSPARKSRPAHTYKGWVVLDPGQFWRVCESQMQVDYADKSENMVVSSTVECTMDGEYPVPKKTIIEGKGTLVGKPFHQTTTVEYTIDRIDADASEFTLTAFGLKEPMGMPPVNRAFHLWFWISLAAIASIGFAALCWKLKRRYEIPQSAKS